MRIRIHRHPLGEAVLARLVAGYIRLVQATGRFELRCDPAAAELIRARRPLIGAFWHGRMLMIPPAWVALTRDLGLTSPLQPYVAASDHADGRFITRATERLGLKTVTAPTKKAGGLGLLRGVLKVLDEGQIAVLTPDGPRGPRMRAKGGTLLLAIRAGVPIIPVTAASRRQLLLASWDRFAVPQPFDRGVFAFGRPLVFAEDSDPKTAAAQLERELNLLTSEAERAVGREPVASG
jgi:lysophospholipid acyltransferase (LPLAT)-like uncharacterized protein